jgi:hypothetical protein
MITLGNLKKISDEELKELKEITKVFLSNLEELCMTINKEMDDENELISLRGLLFGINIKNKLHNNSK